MEQGQTQRQIPLFAWEVAYPLTSHCEQIFLVRDIKVEALKDGELCGRCEMTIAVQIWCKSTAWLYESCEPSKIPWQWGNYIN